LVTSDATGVAAALATGEVVGIPTDTVYGLAALASSESASDRIFELKGRPRGLALPVLVADLEQAEAFLGRSDPQLSLLARRFWPGALTIVVGGAASGAARHLGGGTTVGLRCPDDDAVRDLCRRVGPLTATSANRHGEAPITSASQFAAIFGDEVGVVLDGGSREGRPSNVVSIAAGRPQSLRDGPIAWSEITAALSSQEPS
jgi:L-threonylcarbamoyladenylate synthase